MKFLRQQGNFKKRLEKKWKKPKGRHSKLREKRRGMHKMPSIGFKQSEKDRQKQLIINNLNDLNSLKKGDKVRLSGKVSNKNKLKILNECAKKGIIVSNYKDPKKKVKELSEAYDQRVKDKKKKVKPVKKEVKKPEPKKKVVVKKKAPAKTTEKKKVVVKK